MSFQSKNIRMTKCDNYRDQQSRNSIHIEWDNYKVFHFLHGAMGNVSTGPGSVKGILDTYIVDLDNF